MNCSCQLHVEENLADAITKSTISLLEQILPSFLNDFFQSLIGDLIASVLIGNKELFGIWRVISLVVFSFVSNLAFVKAGTTAALCSQNCSYKFINVIDKPSGCSTTC